MNISFNLLQFLFEVTSETTTGHALTTTELVYEELQLPRSTPPAPSCAGPPPRPPPGTGHQGGPGSPEQKLRQDCLQPWPGHHKPEIITYVKESESSKQDIAVPLPQEHVTIIYTTMATCAALHRHEVPAENIENMQAAVSPSD